MWELAEDPREYSNPQDKHLIHRKTWGWCGVGKILLCVEVTVDQVYALPSVVLPVQGHWNESIARTSRGLEAE